MTEPYRSTPIFNETTLPPGLRGEHRTRVGVWGLIRVLEGKLLLQVLDPVSKTVLTPTNPGLVLPEQSHHVTPLGPMRMQIDFFDKLPVPD